jgi:hypothetical protein
MNRIGFSAPTGQPTDVDLRYVLDAATAAEVARAWLAGDALPPLGEWERR